MQLVHIVVGDEIQCVELPDPSARTSGGVPWGDASVLLSPAWIAKHAHMRWRQNHYGEILQPGASTLYEEVVFCILSGFGIKAEMAAAAFRRLQESGLFEKKLDRDGIERELTRPLILENGRSARYRFPKVRANYIQGALEQLSLDAMPKEGAKARDWLMRVRGIGPKTASFIVRNHLGSDAVAILDIHVMRAGQISGIFPQKANLINDYAKLERMFLAFAEDARVPASILDMTIWDMMRQLPKRRLAEVSTYCRRDCEGTLAVADRSNGLYNGDDSPMFGPFMNYG